MASPLEREIPALSRSLSTLLNRQLQQICAINGLKQSGVKADLQNRITYRLREFANSGNTNGFNQVKSSIMTVRGNGGPSQGHSSSSPAPPRNNNNYSNNGAYSLGAYGDQLRLNQQNGYGSYNSSNSRAPAAYSPQQSLKFKNSPFYTIHQQIGSTRTLEVIPNHRNAATIPLKVTDFPFLSQCTYDQTMKVMVFCAGDGSGTQDIAFPHNCELKVNGGDVKANLRGLKNKAGSTRPVDITKHLRLDKASYVNNVELQYALTQKKFYLQLYLCRVVPANDLADRIKSGKKIPKTSVIAELNRKAADPDVVATSQVLSLKCPLTYMRLNNPCRSISCSHIQCFDALSYILLQEQGPQWICPICNKSAPFDSLAIDEYVKDLLERTSDETEQVTIEPDGQWRVVTEEKEDRRKSNGPVATPAPPSAPATVPGIKIDDDDDLIALSDLSAFTNGRSYQTPSRSFVSNGTSNAATPVERSSVPAPGSASRKRPAPEVVDLTLSSDEEDDVYTRPTKRTNFGTSNGLTYPSYPQ